MSQDIRSVLAALIGLQKGLRISDPLPVEIKGAYRYPPGRDVALPDRPCWLNSWDLITVHRHTTGGTYRASYVITSDLYVEDADLDVAADIATAFLKPYMLALQQNITLNQTCQTSDLRGGTPTLALLERAGKAYPGLHLLLDVQTEEAATFQ